MTVTPFTPIRMGPVEMRSRLAMAPVKTALGGPDGLICARHVAYYRRRAEGGAGMIIVEPLFVDSRGREHPRQLAAHRDVAIGGLRRVVNAIHENGSLAFAHLNHAGRAANPKVIGESPEAPSAVTCPTSGATPEPMSTERIGVVLEAYRNAAHRVREAGFDGVEIQLGLGYLPAQFLSPRTSATMTTVSQARTAGVLLTRWSPPSAARSVTEWLSPPGFRPTKRSTEGWESTTPSSWRSGSSSGVSTQFIS